MTLWHKLIVACLIFVSCSLTPAQEKHAVDLLGMAVQVFVATYGQPVARFQARCEGCGEVLVYDNYTVRVNGGIVTGIEITSGGGK